MIPFMKHPLLTPFCLSILTAAAVAFTPSSLRAGAQEEHNKELVRSWHEDMLDVEKYGRMDEVFHEDVVVTLSPGRISAVSGTNQVSGLENLKKHHAIHSKKYDFDFDIRQMIAEGDTVIAYMITTHTEDGKKTQYPCAVVCRIEDGKIREMTIVRDNLHTVQKSK